MLPTVDKPHRRRRGGNKRQHRVVFDCSWLEHYFPTVMLMVARAVVRQAGAKDTARTLAVHSRWDR
jgi:hypothetical protein